MKNILIVDVRLICYESYHRNLPFPTFFDTVVKETLPYVMPNRIVWAYDSPKGSIRRKELYPEYKAHRKEKIKTAAEKAKLKAFNQNYNKLEEVLSCLGNVVHLNGYEADDIANIVTDITKDKYNVYLLSSDKDWIVNIKQPNIYQIHLKRGLIDYDNVNSVFGVSPEYVLKVQALTGIAKENVKGVYRLGEGRVYKWLQEGKTMDEIIAMVEEFTKSGKYGMKKHPDFDSVKEMYEFNYELLRPLTLDDLSDRERETLRYQINFKNDCDDIELKIIQTLNVPFLFQDIHRKFYKIY